MRKPEPVTVFLAYAHEDELLCSELEKHLSLLQRQGLLSTWQDRRIRAGTDWAQEIDKHSSSASIILLLVSSDFLASDYCYGVEMQRALERHQAGQTQVIPVLLRSVDWKGAPFQHLQGLPTDARPITKWPDRDEAWTNVATGIRRVIEELPPLSVNLSPAGLPPVWNIPYPHNPLFTGREELLTQLASTLHAGQPTALSQPQAISGLGGIGKTQLALQYAYRSRGDYQAVLWTQADTRENLTSSYLTIAALLNLPEKNEQESARVIAAVKHWLQRNTSWLLILDNADDLALARDFLPPSAGGHVLLTTRAQAMGRFAHRLEVDILSTELGALFLLRRTGRLAPDATLELAETAEQVCAKEMCEELGGLPLALDQAGAYIEETGCSLSDYQQRYQSRRAQLLQRRGGLVPDHPDAVTTTWSLAFEKVQQTNPAAADLLRLCAFLAPDAIPEEIITKGATDLGPVPEPVASDAVDLDEAIAALGAYSLVRRNPSTKILSIHRLVQAVLKDGMSKDLQYQWAERTVRIVNHACPDIIVLAVRPHCHLWLPHALACAALIDQWNLNFYEATRLLTQAGFYLEKLNRHEEALAIFEQSIRLGSNNVEAQTGRGLALRMLYRYEEALRAFELAIQQNPTFALSHVGRGVTFRMLHRYEDALAALELAIQQNPTFALAYINKGFVFRMLLRHVEALETFKQAIQIDPNESNAYAGKGFALYSLSRYQEATEAFEQAIRLDPNNVDAYNGRGHVLCRMKCFDEALTVHEHVLRLNPHEIDALIGKGFALYGLSRYQEAAEAFEQAIRLDPNNVDAYDGKVLVLCQQGCFNEALTVHENVLRLIPNFAHVWYHRGDILKRFGRLEEALQVYAKARQLESREESL